jgi:hypothetical protein
LLGRSLGRLGPDSDSDDSFGLLDGAVFALLGLLFGFTFSSAASRFDSRRALIIEEASAISTARLRVDPVPAWARQSLIDSFDRHVRSRVASYEQTTDPSGFA